MKKIKNGQIFVYTYKEGLLSPVAHDLKIELTGFSVQFNGGDLEADFDVGTFSVISAMLDGAPQFGALSANDRAKIEKTIRTDVLRVKRYPRARLKGRVTNGKLEAELELMGRTAPIEGQISTENGRAMGLVSMRPTNWGVKPYTALFGALRLKDYIKIITLSS